MSIVLALWLLWFLAAWCNVVRVALINVGAVLVLSFVFTKLWVVSSEYSTFWLENEFNWIFWIIIKFYNFLRGLTWV